MKQNKQTLALTLPYLLGIVIDGIWAIALFFPPLLVKLIGRPDLVINFQLKLIAAIGGVLMTGWTVLLVWAMAKPVERRGVLLITAFPVVFGMFCIALIGYLKDNPSNLWIIFKTFILLVLMIRGYLSANRNAHKNGGTF